jgi:TRAP transporter TAXI family solute receptor
MKLSHIAFFSGLAFALSSSAYAIESYRLAGGATGGGWHPAWSAATQLLNEKLADKYRFQYTPTGGSVDNVRRIRLGSVISAWGQIPQIYQAWTGTGQFQKDGPSHDFRVIANVREQSQIVAVLADSPIHSFSDMKGKVVNLLSKGTGSSTNCVNIFKALGLYDKIERRWLGFAASGRALGDQQIDVFCSGGTPYRNPSLTEVSIRKPVRYISLTKEEQEKVVSAYKFYSPLTIPVLKDINGMDKPALSIGYDVWWIVSKNIPDKVVTDMLTVIANPKNLKDLTSAAGYWKNLSGNFQALEHQHIYVHPAAARYWESRGVKVPKDLVKGF